jgi:Protein of unknown function (DUF1559)
MLTQSFRNALRVPMTEVIRHGWTGLVCIGLIGVFGCGESLEQNFKKRMARRGDDEEASGNSRLSDDGKSFVAKPEPKFDTPGGTELDKDNPYLPRTLQDQPKEDDSSTKPEEKPAAPPRVLAKDAKEHEAMTRSNLSKIALAMEQYVRENGMYPKQAVLGGPNGDKPLLSWRVMLLPYLGHQEIFRQFRLNEPWDSPYNVELLSQIPPEYQSPARSDSFTNYLLPVGSFTGFPPVKGSRVLVEFEDGVENTIILVEASDKVAVPWTKPVDWEVKSHEIAKGLGFFADKGFMAVLGGGRVSKLKADLKNEELMALLSVDMGEPISLSEILVVEEGKETLGAMAERGITDDALEARSVPEAPTESAVESAVNSFARESAKLMIAGRQLEAIQRHFCSIILQTDNAEVIKQFRWSPALKRPVNNLRIGLAVDIGTTGEWKESPDPIDQKLELVRIVNSPGVNELEKYTGELGNRTLKFLHPLYQKGAFGDALAGGVDSEKLLARPQIEEVAFQPVMNRPGIEILGWGTNSAMRQLAAKRDMDVMVIFDVSAKRISAKGSASQNSVHNTTLIKFVDVIRGDTLIESIKFNNIQIKRDRLDPSKDDPVLTAFKRLEEQVEQKLMFKDIPTLPATAVQQRVATLLESKHRNPLKAMAEIRFYIAQGLISKVEGSEALDKLAGQPEFGFLLRELPEQVKLLASLVENETWDE